MHCATVQDVIEEVHAFNELHGEEPAVAFDQELIEVDQIGVSYVRKRAELIFEKV